MQTAIFVEKTLDLRGQPCPLVLLKIKMAMEKMAVGQVLEVTSTDPCTEYDIPTWTKRTGRKLLKTIAEKETIKFLIQKI